MKITFEKISYSHKQDIFFIDPEVNSPRAKHVLLVKRCDY